MADAQTVVFLAVDDRAAGLIGVDDPIKPSSSEAIGLLHKEEIKMIMLTGDSQTTAEAVGRKLGLDQIEAEVLPSDSDKAAVVRKLQDQGNSIVMAAMA